MKLRTKTYKTEKEKNGEIMVAMWISLVMNVHITKPLYRQN